MLLVYYELVSAELRTLLIIHIDISNLTIGF